MITVHCLQAFKPTLKGIIRDVRTIWTLEELGVPYERKIMNAMKGEHKQPAFLALNPFGKVPTIQDGEVTLYESSAICIYLGDKYGKLMPGTGLRERALYNQWMAFATATLEPMAFRVFGYDHGDDKNPVAEKIRNDSLGHVDGWLGVVDAELGKRPYLLGDAFTIADIMMSSVARIVQHTEVAAKHPRFAAYLKKNYARPGFERALKNHG